MDEQQKWKSIAAGVGAVAMVAMCCAIYGCSQDKKEQPKVMEYRQTTDPGAVKKELGVSDQTARAITREIYHVQSSDTPPTSLYANPLSLDRGFVLYIIIYPNTFPREGVFACNEISIRDEFLHEFTKQNQ